MSSLRPRVTGDKDFELKWGSNGVYWFGNGEYKQRFTLFPVESFLHQSPSEFVYPIGLSPWHRKTMNPFAFAWMGKQLAHFDTLSVVQWLRSGVDFGFKGIPFGSSSRLRNSGTDEGYTYFREVIIPKQLRKSQIKKITNKIEKDETVIVPVALIPKTKAGTFRLIHNLKADLVSPTGDHLPSLNDSSPWELIPSVGLANVGEIIVLLVLLQALGFQDTIHMASFDLESAYYQIPLAYGMGAYLGFMFDGVVYQTLGLPFGSKAAPEIFCRTINIIWQFMRSLWIFNWWYMDDSCLIGRTYDETTCVISTSERILDFAGVTINYDKSIRSPVRELDYIGLQFLLDLWIIKIRAKTILKMKQVCQSLLEVKRRWHTDILAHRLQTLIGCMNFAEQVIKQLRPLKHFFIGTLKALDGETHYSLSNVALAFVGLTLKLLSGKNSTPIATFESLLLGQHEHLLATDASLEGFGGWALDAEGIMHYFYGSWAELLGLESGFSIADYELVTHIMAVDLLLPVVLPGARAVTVRIDNTNALSWVNNLRCSVNPKDPVHMNRLGWIMSYQLMCSLREVDVQTEYISTSLNVEADALSRPGTKLTAFLASLPISAQRIEVAPRWLAAWSKQHRC